MRRRRVLRRSEGPAKTEFQGLAGGTRVPDDRNAFLLEPTGSLFQFRRSGIAEEQDQLLSGGVDPGRLW